MKIRHNYNVNEKVTSAIDSRICEAYLFK